MDNGHRLLCFEIQELLNDATAYEFHDFKNTKYSMPKIALVQRLQDLIDRVKTGKYDNG